MNSGLLTTAIGDGRTLLLVAVAAEARTVLAARGWDSARASVAAEEAWRLHSVDGRFDLVVTGVGKAAAAGGAGRFLDPDRHRAALSVGVCGSLPWADGGMLAPRTAIVATEVCLADEGVATARGFEDVATMGFPPLPGEGMSFATDPDVRAALAQAADVEGVIATVSTCSGTNALAEQIAGRTGAVAEAMEGAAIAVTARRLGVLFGELRVVSNTTGERSSQRWDLPGALQRLGEVVAGL